MKERKLTVTGDIDPVNVVSKLRKSFRRTEIVTVGPATEPKPPEKKPNEYYPPPPMTTYYYARPPPPSAEEDPNSCVIS
ncbi:unnamed protein product [Linum tenue]|uniref:HMA domain-containing protein n=1 Tax=Linum tenue TaxID=586396 RepID=A0AAV0QNF1_9ROSI|nr:unnamed protein product [Linum tenue]